MQRREFLERSLLATIAVPKLFSLDLKSENSYVSDEFIKDLLSSNREVSKVEDVIFQDELYSLLKSVDSRLERVRFIVGYGSFNLISFDEAIKIAQNYSKVGEFTKKELDFVEELFYFKANKYGFFGDKINLNLTDSIKDKNVNKIPYTGHYLYKDRSIDMYEKIKKDVGDTIILTSGVRGIVKQMQLFTSKAISVDGNMSLASRSLAPPGYSYHGIGDFDVGKVGFGYKNFSEEFAHTNEFEKLIQLGYINIRYPKENKFGVRFEPWHIKVV